jgi:separase
MGMLSTGQFVWTPPSPDILDALANAEKLLWSHLNLMAQKGSVVKVREAAILLALVGSFQTSLGNQRNKVPWVMASLLGTYQFANVTCI